jgi:hypothetical protein
MSITPVRLSCQRSQVLGNERVRQRVLPFAFHDAQLRPPIEPDRVFNKSSVDWRQTSRGDSVASLFEALSFPCNGTQISVIADREIGWPRDQVRRLNLLAMTRKKSDDHEAKQSAYGKCQGALQAASGLQDSFPYHELLFANTLCDPPVMVLFSPRDETAIPG